MGDVGDKYAGTESKSAMFDQIMVRFRPIAPKPVIGTPAEVIFTKRKKRRYIKKKKKVLLLEEVNISAGSDPSPSPSPSPSPQVVEEEEEVVTLSLLQKEIVTLSLLPDTPVLNTTISILDLTPIQESNQMVQMLQQQSTTSLESVVIMECVQEIGSTEMVDLEKDTCPGFISDGYDRVWWINTAYRTMVGSEMVRVVMKDRFPVTWGSAFVCRVRLLYTLREMKKSMIVPCDVWKINGGNFAWRLDVQAALSLGR
ncbi:hypothetical protein ACHQM5_001383 [Ranunculus cassubicifolius]